MSTTLALTALLMGLAGGPHCAVMCGAACAGVGRLGRGSPVRNAWFFQAGRVVGYATAGGLAAATVEGAAWLGSQTAALKPVWTLAHLAVLAWGLTLLVLARQPAWVDSAGRSLWQRVRPLALARGGVFFTGTLWTLVPCGLLYSALLVAALAGSVGGGALNMALFALGSGLSLALAPALVRRLQGLGNRWRQDWGTRLAGLLLALAATGALWMDMAQRVSAWCASW